MANETEQIYIKVGIDTSTFNDSMTGMKKEIIALKGLVGNSILSKEEQAAVLGRMTKLKDEIGDITNATSKVKGFEVLGKTLGPVVAGMGAMAGTAKMLGAEWKVLEKTETIMMTTMNAAMALQQLKDLSELKGMAAAKGARLAKILSINVETASVGVATVAQRAWNAAINANPIGLFITAIVALVAAIGGLIFWYKRQNEVSAETKKMLKEVIDAHKEYNDVIKKITTTQEEEIAKRSRKLKGALQVEEDIISANAKFKLDIETAITSFTANQAALRVALREAEADGDSKTMIKWLNAIKTSQDLHNQNLIKIAKNHTELLNVIQKQGDEDALKLKKETDEKNKKLLTDKQQKEIDKLTADYDFKIGLVEGDKEATKKLTLEKYDALIALANQFKISAEKFVREKAIFEQNIIKEEQQKEIENTKAYYENQISIVEISGKDTYALKEEQYKKLLELYKQYNLDTTQIEYQHSVDVAQNEKNKIEKSIKLLDDWIVTVEEKAQEGNEAFIKGLGLDDLETSGFNKFNDLLEKIRIEKERLEKERGEKIRRINLDWNLTDSEKADRIKETNAFYDELGKNLDDKSNDIVKKAKDLQKRMVDTLVSGSIDLIGKGLNALIDAQLSNIQRAAEEAMATLDEVYQNNSDNLDDLLKGNYITQEEFDRKKEKLDKDKAEKEKKIKQEQWKAEKEAALLRIIINTAVGVMMDYAQGGAILGSIMALLTIAAGAIEYSAVSSTKEPKFKMGGYVSGPSHETGGVKAELEGGEYIVRKEVVQQPGMYERLSYINSLSLPRFEQGGYVNRFSPLNSTMRNVQPSQTINNYTTDIEDLKQVIRDVVSIPVVVTETDITRTQKRVSVIETRASW